MSKTLVNGSNATEEFSWRSGNWLVRARCIPDMDIIAASSLFDITSQSWGVSLILLGSYPYSANEDLYFSMNSGPGLGVLEYTWNFVLVSNWNVIKQIVSLTIKRIVQTQRFSGDSWNVAGIFLLLNYRKEMRILNCINILNKHKDQKMSNKNAYENSIKRRLFRKLKILQRL